MFKKDAIRAMSFTAKKDYKLLTIEDQEEALTNPKFAVDFARLVPGADIKKCQDVVLCSKNSYYAYAFAVYITGADIEQCQEVACKDAKHAYGFALQVRGADIQKCQEAACADADYAFKFARNIKGADIEYCLNRFKHDDFLLSLWNKHCREFGK